MAIKLIIGLGNEGRQYQNTYHNVGRFCADLFQQEKSSGDDFEFFTPPGFMNTIGIPIAEYTRKRPLAPEEVLIIHDDSDLPVGAYKLVLGGGSAGHNGVQSTADHLGTEMFWRLRIGVRNPAEVDKDGIPATAPRVKAGDFVLKKFPKKEAEIFKGVCQQAWEELIQISKRSK